MNVGEVAFAIIRCVWLVMAPVRSAAGYYTSYTSKLRFLDTLRLLCDLKTNAQTACYPGKYTAGHLATT